MKKIFVTILVALCTGSVSATNYYLSTKGSDLNSGTSKLTPWRSLTKLLEVMPTLKPGDSILFERGGVFHGELKLLTSGKAGNEIYVGAYGSGDNPIINGAKEITHWTLFRGNIWVADCAECIAEPNNLFQNGQYQTPGRYPNSGYFPLSCTSKCKTTLTDNHHEFADGYWDGSEVVVKSSRWTLDNLQVSSYFDKTFYFSGEASYPLQNGFGYFIQKHLATLDKAGEWFFDIKSSKIFMYYQDGDKPGNHIIEVGVTEAGLSLMNVRFVVIENLSFRYQRTSGAHLIHCSNITLRNCEFEHSGNNGLEIISCQNPVVDHCTINNSSNNGVEWSDNSEGSFVRNFIRRTGLHPGRGKSGNGSYIGISISSGSSSVSNNHFQYNSVDSTGYIGIDFRTGGTTLKQNLISNFCMIKDDGAGIYTWGNAYGNNHIDENIVLKGIGCAVGTNDPDQVWAHGIYIDDRSSDINVNNNTVAYCATNGIFVHNARRISIQGNTLFANGASATNKETAELFIKLDALVPGSQKNLEHQIVENRFITLGESSHCVHVRDEKEGSMADLGLLDRNYYYAPKENQVAANFNNQHDICNAMEEFKLSEWQHCSENDKNSHFSKLDGIPIGSNSSNLIKNGRMAYGIDGWVVWPSQVFIAQDKKGEDRPSLRVQFPAGKVEALLYHAGFSLKNNKTYRLSFSAMSKSQNKIEFAPLMASSPWEALDDYACFSIDTVFKSFTYIFKPKRNCKEARVNFKSNSTFWIDNVTLSEVVPKLRTEGLPVQLFYNAYDTPKTVPLSGAFKDLDGKQLSGTMTINGYHSIVLLKQ